MVTISGFGDEIDADLVKQMDVMESEGGLVKCEDNYDRVKTTEDSRGGSCKLSQQMNINKSY